MSLTPPPDYSFQQPTLLPRARKELSTSFHPVSSLLGLLSGLVLVSVLLSLGWFFAKDDASPVLTLQPLGTSVPLQTKEAPVSAAYNSAVVGSPKPMVGSLFETQKVSLQEAAMMDVLRINQPVGKIYQSKPLKELPTKSIPLQSNAPLYLEALQLLKHYQSETRLESKCLTSIQSEATLEQMKNYYVFQNGSEPLISQQSRGFLITMGETQIVQLDFPCSNRPDGLASAFFHRTRANSLLLDWQAYVGYSSLSWPEYRRTKPQTPIWLRAIASAGDYYNYEFSDKARYLCVKLTSPDGIHKIYGYVPRAVKLADLLLKRLNYEQLELTGSSKELMKVVVKTTFHYPAESDQCVNIRGIILDRWFHFDWETEDKP
jgi:hypothetical protein